MTTAISRGWIAGWASQCSLDVNKQVTAAKSSAKKTILATISALEVAKCLWTWVELRWSTLDKVNGSLEVACFLSQYTAVYMGYIDLLNISVFSSSILLVRQGLMLYNHSILLCCHHHHYHLLMSNSQKLILADSMHKTKWYSSIVYSALKLNIFLSCCKSIMPGSSGAKVCLNVSGSDFDHKPIECNAKLGMSKSIIIGSLVVV